MGTPRSEEPPAECGTSPAPAATLVIVVAVRSTWIFPHLAA